MIGAGVGRLEPDGVALELFDHGEQVVRHRARLRRLRVRVRREDVLAVAAGQIEQHLAQRERRLEHREHQLPLLHPVHRHVDVVARARGVEAAGHLLAAGGNDQPIDVEEQVLVGAVVGDAADVLGRNRVERGADGPRVRARHDPLLGEHHEMRVVDPHQRPEELGLGVLEVLVEDALHVLGGKSHERWKLMYTTVGSRQSRIGSQSGVGVGRESAVGNQSRVGISGSRRPTVTPDFPRPTDSHPRFSTADCRLPEYELHSQSASASGRSRSCRRPGSRRRR